MINLSPLSGMFEQGRFIIERGVATVVPGADDGNDDDSDGYD
jgi:hypothetical protein